MQIEVRVLNELFSKLDDYLIQSPRKDYEDFYQKFYKHPEMPEGIFLRIDYETDSYGGDDRISDVSFVEGREKTITVFEPVIQ